MSFRRAVVSAERWAAIDAIFADATELPTAERAAFVANACGSDAELRAEVESLLSAHDGDTDFLEQPHAAAREGPDLATQLQAALGTAFHIERELTGGGMSRVFVATETALKRRVVIKVLSPELVSPVMTASQSQLLPEHAPAPVTVWKVAVPAARY